MNSPDISVFANLKDRALRDEGIFIAEGGFLVERALASGLEMIATLCSARMAERIAPLAQGRCPLVIADESEIARLVGFPFHRGVMTAGRRPAPLGIERFLASNPPARRLVICAGLDSDDNLGSIMRSAAALDYDAIARTPGGSDPWSRRALRASMGAGFTLPLLAIEREDDAIGALRDHGFAVYATVLASDARPIPAFRACGKHALVFGNEASGLDAAWRDRCDRAITIPIARGDSLNVGVAAGIFMYHCSLLAGDGDPAEHP
ncbi:MAG TPA: RNA methyltransferase [Spirochaetota bacterium]|nr:RNA methyltransferase [Spirochaetota bacterium]HNT10171.1 RNA methyltransferase [Spirochaetota bacterium]